MKSPRHQPDLDSIAEEQQSPVASGAGDAGSPLEETTITSSSSSAPVWTQQDHPHSWKARIARGDNVLVIARDVYSLLVALDPAAYNLPYGVRSQFCTPPTSRSKDSADLYLSQSCFKLSRLAKPMCVRRCEMRFGVLWAWATTRYSVPGTALATMGKK